MTRIFMSVPDGPYWAAKEKRDAADRRGDQPPQEEEVKAKPRKRRKARFE